MPEQLLYGPDIVAGFEQVSSEAMPERVASYPLLHSCELRGVADMLLEGAGAHVVSAHNAGPRVEGKPAAREDVLPDPFPVGGWELALEGEGQVNGAVALAQVLLVDAFSELKLILQGADQGIGKNREPILCALSVADDDLPKREVQVFHPEPRAFHGAQPAPVQ
jgi:hypothetical protein